MIPSSRWPQPQASPTKLALVTNLSVIPYRNPLLLAKSAATLNRMSEGRFYMGAGAGYLKSEYFALGVDFKERNALFEEALEVMQLHWSGEPFDFEGRHFSARNIRALPAPRHNSGPDLDGRQLRCRAQACRDLRRRVDADDRARLGGEDGADAARDDDRPSCEERLDALKRFAGDRYDELALILSYSGPSLAHFERDAEQIRHRLGEMDEMGVDWTIIGPPWSPAPGTVEWLQAFGATFLQG